MKKLPFKVSAKTARLIGRENVANAEGAISELVKNAYDADATNCVLAFLPKYRAAPKSLSSEEFEFLYNITPDIATFYQASTNAKEYQRGLGLGDDEVLLDILSDLTELWILDNGTGMSTKTVETHWMVIGTNFKEENMVSQAGRARTGAKGIGRFALDRLGAKCQMVSTTKVSSEPRASLNWSVDWGEFDDPGKVLHEISATLESSDETIKDVLDQVLSNRFVDDVTERMRSKAHWSTGTAIKISDLRDNWRTADIESLHNTLGAMVPPAEQRPMDIFLLDARSPSEHGLVAPQILSDYDYRIKAEILRTGDIKFHLFRNELETARLEPDFFAREEMKGERFNRASFSKDEIVYKKKLDSLFPGVTESWLKTVKELGPFEITLSYFKRAPGSRRDAEIYPYRDFQAAPRKSWLEQYGGIKVYRDNFAVRPYGEHNGEAFDWLSLGQRVAVSPVAASRKGWKVTPQNVSGTVNISRVDNPRLRDQANRQGIMQGAHFEAFRNIIIRVLQEFEDDRSHIHHNLNEYHKDKNQDERAKSEGAKTASKIVSSGSSNPGDAEALAKGFIAQQKEIEELLEEQTMLRALATLGTVLVSFSHEMGQLQNTMGGRSSELGDILSSYLDRDDLIMNPSPFNPYTILEEWERDDERVKQWFRFALSSVKPDRRRRRKVVLSEHLSEVAQAWAGFLNPRKVDLTIEDVPNDLSILAFEIDLDSIFNNLILNSVEAFLSSRHSGKRKIEIKVRKVQNKIQIDYSDNGPGLHKSIKQPNDIFKFSVSTKMNENGEQVGTGIGMWILSTVVNAYKGNAIVTSQVGKPKFSLRITLPIKGK